jgi:hypothetical protein
MGPASTRCAALACCACVVLVESGRLYSAVSSAVSIATEGRLRLTTCGKSPAVADPRHSRRGRVADAGGGHRAARSCSGLPSPRGPNASARRLPPRLYSPTGRVLGHGSRPERTSHPLPRRADLHGPVVQPEGRRPLVASLVLSRPSGGTDGHQGVWTAGILASDSSQVDGQ